MSGTTRVSRYQKKHSPTHLSWSSCNLCQLLPSTTVQIACLAIFLRNLCPHPLSSTSWSGALHLIFHTFLHQSVSSFRNTCPYHRNLFCCCTKIISSLSLSLSSLLGTLSFTLTYLNLLPYLSDLCTDAVKLLCPHLRNKQTFNFLSWHIAAGCHANFTIFCYMGTQEQEILCLYTCLLWHQQKLVCLLWICSYSNLHAELMSQESFRAISCFTVIFFYLN